MSFGAPGAGSEFASLNGRTAALVSMPPLRAAQIIVSWLCCGSGRGWRRPLRLWRRGDHWCSRLVHGWWRGHERWRRWFGRRDSCACPIAVKVLSLWGRPRGPCPRTMRASDRNARRRRAAAYAWPWAFRDNASAHECLLVLGRPDDGFLSRQFTGARKKALRGQAQSITNRQMDKHGRGCTRVEKELVRALLDDLPRGNGAILIDPPTQFKTWSRKGMGRSPDRHYRTLSFEQLAALPIAERPPAIVSCFFGPAAYAAAGACADRVLGLPL